MISRRQATLVHSRHDAVSGLAGGDEGKLIGGRRAGLQLPGDGYAYEKGERAIVPLTCDNATSTLTIGAREGRYPGMAKTESFVVRLLQKDGAWKDRSVSCTGQGKVCRFDGHEIMK